MRTIILLVALAGQLRLGFSQAQNYECTLERLDAAGGEEFCVFRDVRQPAAGAKFGSPSGAAKPSRIAFQGCSMEHIPREFLQQFSTDLKVLHVEGCQLKSVTITNGLEVLRAGNNAIERVVVHQSGQESVLRELDLSRNSITKIKNHNITRCQNLEVLNLSGNSGILLKQNTLQLSDFERLNKLRELYLSDLGVDYLDNTKNTGLDSLVLLDLSHNNLLPSDLQISVFYPFKKLETLRLNDNNMGSIDYNLLLRIESLKTVYLNGNAFSCVYIKSMLDHLNQKGLSTPTEKENYKCNSQQKNFMDMCCTGPLPVTPQPQPPAPEPVNPVTPTPSTITPTVRPVTPVDPARNDVPSEEKDSTPWIIGVVVGVLLAAAAAIAGFLVYKKKQTAAANINGESSVGLRRQSL